MEATTPGRFRGGQVYAVGLYVEPKAAATELGAKDGSFSAGDRVDAVCTALADGKFGKALWLTTV